MNTTAPSCLLCNATAYPYASKNGFDIYRCKQCALIFTYPLPSKEQMEDVYSEDYFSGATGGFGYTDYERDKKPMESGFIRYLEIMEGFIGKDERTLLDVGASTGYFMRLAKNRGWDTTGIEISSYAASKGRESGLNVLEGTLETIDMSHRTFSAITLWDVFEHFPDPKTSIKRCHELLKDDGVLCISTPTSDSLWARAWGKQWNGIMPPEHTFLYNRKNLRTFLEQQNFSIELVTTIGKKFSIAYIFQTAYRWRGKRIYKRIADLLSKGIFGKIWVPLNLRDNIFVVARKSNYTNLHLKHH